MDVPDSKAPVPEKASHYERLLNEVEATEGQLGAILRCLVCLVGGAFGHSSNKNNTIEQPYNNNMIAQIS